MSKVLVGKKNMQIRYLWSPAGLDVLVSVYDSAENTTYYYHTDANKNITELTNASGSVVAHYEYSPFGKVVVSTGTYVNVNPFRFSSEYHDDETGLVYYNYRYYSPELGRWLSRDPIGEDGGKALNVFSRNNPILLLDYLGQACCYGQHYNPLYQECCHTAKKVFNRFTQCCIENEGIYQRSDSWEVKICFRNMGLGPIGHVWVESGDIARGFYANPDSFGLFAILDSGMVQDDSEYSKRKEGTYFYSYWNNETYKYCIPIHVSKCRYDIKKFNSVLAYMRPSSFYSILGEFNVRSDKIGMELLISLPKYIDLISIPFNLSISKDCHSAAYAMIAEAARKSKR